MTFLKNIFKKAGTGEDGKKDAQGADADDRQGWSQLHLAAFSGDLETMAELIAQGADVNASEKNGRTPLHVAIEQGQADAVTLLLNQPKIDIEIREENGFAPIHLAVGGVDAGILRALIKIGADVNARDDGENNMDWTPLHLAAEIGRTEMAKVLIEHGADVNATDIYGRTALFRAEDSGHREVAETIEAVMGEKETERLRKAYTAYKNKLHRRP